VDASGRAVGKFQDGTVMASMSTAPGPLLLVVIILPSIDNPDITVFKIKVFGVLTSRSVVIEAFEASFLLFQLRS
jgi:hypothetical protein